MLINNQFVQVAPPIMVTLGLAAWLNNKTVDGIGKRIDDLNKLIDASIRDPSDRIARLEERSSPLARR